MISGKGQRHTVINLLKIGFLPETLHMCAPRCDSQRITVGKRYIGHGDHKIPSTVIPPLLSPCWVPQVSCPAAQPLPSMAVLRPQLTTASTRMWRMTYTKNFCFLANTCLSSQSSGLSFRLYVCWWRDCLCCILAEHQCLCIQISLENHLQFLEVRTLTFLVLIAYYIKVISVPAGEGMYLQ